MSATEDLPVISVVIAARNESEFLRPCLHAVSGQVFSHPFEILVVDNASTDSTLAIANEFNCRVLFEPIPNQVLAKYVGVSSASAHIVVVLDADCTPPQFWLRNIYEALTEVGSSTTIAVTCCYQFSGLPWWGRIYTEAVRIFLVGAYRRCFRSMPFVIGGNVAFKRKRLLDDLYPQSGGIAETELGLAKRLNRIGVIRYLPSMSVPTSSRRFDSGLLRFFLHYKWGEYFLPYLRRKIWSSRRSSTELRKLS